MTQTPPPTAIETVSELKPCPFCGSKAISGATLDNSWYAMCESDSCWAMTGYLETEAEAIAAWNRRSLDTADGVEVDEKEVIALIFKHLGQGGMSALTHDSGPYEIATLNHGVMEFARAVTTLASRTPNTETVVKAKPRLTDAAIRAACMAHFGTDNVDGVCVTVNDNDWTFRDAFKRMWHGAWSVLASPPSPAEVTITDEMVFAAMAKADELGEPLDDIDAREILTAALQLGKEG
jgi:Lar family restriction alleviation protein